MSDVTRLEEPIAYTPEERREFARLVCQGFASAGERLEERIRAARCLAFHYSAAGPLAAVAALKVPNRGHRENLFMQAGSPVSAADYELELGWVYVVPAHRGKTLVLFLRSRPSG